MVVLEHNFGHEKGSLLHCLASMTKPAEKDLRYKDAESIRVASRKHKVVPGGARTRHRTKINCRNIVNNVNNNGYEAGMDPINRTNE